MTAHVLDAKSSDTAPLSNQDFKKITDDACASVLTEEYDHDSTSRWNNDIIRKIIASLQEKTKGYKFVVYVTSIDKSTTGPNGIRTSVGSYWNAEKDGVWNSKYDGQHTDAVVSIAWIHSA